MKLPIKIETILITALRFVFSDHGNFLLRKSLIKLFPNPMKNEYMAEIRMLSKKLVKFFSSVNTKKKKNPMPSEM